MNNQSDSPKGTFGAPKNFKGKAILAFIDLLGFSKRVMENWDSDNNNPLDQLMAIKNHIQTSTHTPVTNPSQPSRTYYPNVRMTSDSIVICIALPAEEIDIEHDIGTAAWCMLGVVRDAIEKCLEMGFAVRGAVEYGYIYWDGRDVVGPVLISAYVLESKVAKVARVLVGPELLLRLSSIEYCLDSMYQSEDGLIAVVPAWRKTAKLIEDFEEVMASCPSVYQLKYSDLKRYFEHKRYDEGKLSITQVVECAGKLKEKVAQIL